MVFAHYFGRPKTEKVGTLYGYFKVHASGLEPFSRTLFKTLIKVLFKTHFSEI